MKTYWDYTEKQRSKMTDEEVRAFISAELMMKGVSMAIPPTLRTIKEVKLEKTRYYQVEGIVFKTAEDAESFFKLNPGKSSYVYNGAGYDYQYFEPVRDRIEPVFLYSETDVKTFTRILSENKTAKEFNDKAEKDYQACDHIVQNALEGLWEDWYRCQGLGRRFEKINNTRKEYLALTENNEEMAITFLKKIYNDEDIAMAEKWVKEE